MLNDSNAEKRVLSGILKNKSLPDSIRNIDFSNKANRVFFEILSRLIADSLPLESNIIESFFPEQERGAVSTFIEELQSVDSGNVDGNVKYLNVLTERRNLSTILQTAISDIGDPSKETSEILNTLENRLIHVPRKDDIRNIIVSPSDYITWRKADLNKRLQDGHSFLGTGLYEIDEDLSDGFTPNILSIIAGPTTHGKSITAFKFAKYISSRTDRKEEVLYFAPESGSDKLADRADVELTSIPLKELRNISLWDKNDERFRLLKEAAIEQAKWRLHRLDVRGISSQQLLRICRDYKKRYPNLSVVFVDTVQDLNENIAWKEEGGNQHLLIERMMHRLEVGAKELNLHICLICQLHREYTTRGTDVRKYRADLSRLRGSGSYEEKATWVIFVYRPFISDGGEGDNEIWYTLAKNRDGAIMVTYKYEFIGRRFTIGEYLGKEL